MQIYRSLKETKVGKNEDVTDMAKPKSIIQLYDFGLNMVDAIKGEDSVLTGIQIIKYNILKIITHAISGIKELRHYRWKMDRNGISLNEPIKTYDHLLDAVRYVVQTKLMVRKTYKSKMKVF